MVPLLLTGATGYLGSRVAAAIDRAGLACDVLSQRLETIEPNSLAGYRTVLHCAGALRNRPEQQQTANVDGTGALLRGLAPNCRVVFVSSRSVYPATGHVSVDESQQPRPWDGYGTSKLLAEMALKDSGRPFVIFRSSALFGHPYRSGTFPDHAVDHALAGNSIELATPDRQIDYLDVDMLAELLLRACANGKHWGQIFNVAGPSRSLTEMIETLQNRLLEVVGLRASINAVDIAIPQYPLLDSRRVQSCFPNCSQASDSMIFSRMLAGRSQMLSVD